MMRMLTVFVSGVLLASSTVAAQAPQTPAAPAPAAPAAAAPAAPAAPQPFPADAKIGFVDPQLVLEQSVSGKASLAQINQLVEKKQAEIGTKNKVIVALDQEIKANATVWSQTVLSQKQAELTRHQNEIQFMQTQAQTETEALQQQQLAAFQDKVIPIIEALRKEKNLWVILVPGNQIASADPRLDLSGEVVKRLDAAK